MVLCCGKEEEDKNPGMMENRKCRDVLFLLAFIGFWVGMFVVCGIAFKTGNPARLVYGMDSYGMLCGQKNTFNGTSRDFTSRKNLHYLNALDLLDPVAIAYAKSVCVADCPTYTNMCNVTSLPCTANAQYQCPYYFTSSLYGKLGSTVDDLSTAYYDKLPNDANPAECAANAGFLTQINTAYPSVPNACSSYWQAKSQMPGRGPCYPVWVRTSAYFNRCFPIVSAELVSKAVTSAGVAASSTSGSSFNDYWQSAGRRWDNYVGDISKGILIVVVGGLVGGVCISLIWMVILRYFAGLMAWLTILLVNLALGGITLYCWNMGGMVNKDSQWGAAVADAFSSTDSPTSLSTTHWKYIAYAATAVTGFVFILTLLMLRRIKVAIATIKVASQAVGTMPSILLFPIIPFIFEVGLVVYWIAVTAALYTAGEATANFRSSTSYSPLSISTIASGVSTSAPTAESTDKPASWASMSKDAQLTYCGQSANCYISIDWNTQLKYAFIYHFFGLLWTNQFIAGFACVVIAGAIGSYYWSRGDASAMPRMPVVRALRNATLYHLGSVALGSFIIAVVQAIRFALEYLDHKTKQMQKNNKIAQWAMWCCKCIMWCLEKIVKFINRNAYIMVAVKGTGYCRSAARAISLIVSNVLRLTAVNVIGDALVLLGKVAVAAGGGLIAFGMANAKYYNDSVNYPDTYLSSAILPVALAVLTAFIVAQIFFAVYEMAIDTVFLSFCDDCEAHDGTPQYAPPLLAEAMGVAAAKKA